MERMGQDTKEALESKLDRIESTPVRFAPVIYPELESKLDRIESLNAFGKPSDVIR